mmetsp:Transcript_17987/g.51056  ORF Transcript_17987/g.51056 Transcript_17987/m.51056 type:complete len:173 (-) Transcript_17987:234-752(-)
MALQEVPGVQKSQRRKQHGCHGCKRGNRFFGEAGDHKLHASENLGRNPCIIVSGGQEVPRPTSPPAADKFDGGSEVIIQPLTEKALLQHQMRTMRDQLQQLEQRLACLELARGQGSNQSSPRPPAVSNFRPPPGLSLCGPELSSCATSARNIDGARRAPDFNPAHGGCAGRR